MPLHRFWAVVSGEEEHGCGLSTIRDTELPIRRGEMELDRMRAETQTVRHLPIREACSGQLEHLELPRRKHRTRLQRRLI